MRLYRAKRLWLSLCAAMLVSGCAQEAVVPAARETASVRPTSEIVALEEGLSAVRYEGDYGFSEFLAGGGAASDAQVVGYLADNLLSGLNLDSLLGGVFGCSTVAVNSPDGDALFGRNFDWNTCEALVVAAYPQDGYASLSTVNMDFITQNVRQDAVRLALQLDQVQTMAALYAPLDGMNEKGLAVSVNMIQDSCGIDQDTGKSDLTTTTAVRLLLDRAADVEEALALLRQYDLHSSMGWMVHFALSDASGRSVAVEYIDQEMVVVETPVLTNFYLAAGEKQGVGTQQSHERYDLLMQQLEATDAMTPEQVRDTLDSVSKDNFEEFASTEWSIVYNLTDGEALYYHRENYEKAYAFSLERKEQAP